MQVQNSLIDYSVTPEDALKTQKRIDQQLHAIYSCKSMSQAYPEACSLGNVTEQAHGKLNQCYEDLECYSLIVETYPLKEELKVKYENAFNAVKSDIEKRDGNIYDYSEYISILAIYEALENYLEECLENDEIHAKEKLKFLNLYLPKIEKSYLSYHLKLLKKYNKYFCELERNIVELATNVLLSLEACLEAREALINQKKDLEKRCAKLVKNMRLDGLWKNHLPSLEKAQLVLKYPDQYNYYSKVLATQNLKLFENE